MVLGRILTPSLLRNSSRAMSTFVSKVSPVTGRLEWVIQDEDYDYHQEVARSAYADMLHDTERNQKYYRALRDAIVKMHSQGKPANVLDIGTGTGLLSMMAVRCGADSVTACEAFGPMAHCAEQVIRDNGCANKINLIHKRSTELTVGADADMCQRANILVTEVFDTELIGEGAISTFSHAHQCLLQKDCIVVPTAANIYVQVVESEQVRHWNRFMPIAVPGYLPIKPPTEVDTCPGASAVHDIQMDQLTPDLFTPMTNPVKVFRFDYSSGDSIEYSGETQDVVRAVASGHCDAIFMWWDLEMDTQGQITLSCAPGWAHPTPDNMQWRDHWMQAVYFPPTKILADEGQRLIIRSAHDEYSLWFDVTTNGNEDEPDSVTPASCSERLQKPAAQPACTCGAHNVCSRPRIGMINDFDRNEKFTSVLAKVITSESICLCISDSSLLPLTAAKLGAKHVYTLEPQPASKRMVESFIKHNYLGHRMTVLEKSADKVMIEDLKGQKATVLLGEPYFYTSTLPWDNIYFWYARTDVAEVLDDPVTVVPSCATMKAIAVDFNDLWKIRAPVGHCEGFDLHTFDKLIENASDIADATVEPQPLWEYPGKPLTDQFPLLHLDFRRPLVGLRTVERTGVIPFNSAGTCNGVAIWMDFYVDSKTIVTTGLVEFPKPNKPLKWEHNQRQGVYLFKRPAKIVNVGNGARLKYRVTFRPNSGEFEFKFSAVC